MHKPGPEAVAVMIAGAISRSAVMATCFTGLIFGQLLVGELRVSQQNSCCILSRQLLLQHNKEQERFQPWHQQALVLLVFNDFTHTT